MKKLIVFGAGKIAEVISDYFVRDSDYEIAAYTCDHSFATSEQYCGLPLVCFDDAVRLFPPDRYSLHIAVGYHQLNRLRERLFVEAKAKGYRLASYVSSRSWPGKDAIVGENCFIADGVSLEAGAKIGHNVALWSNVVIGHHSEIRAHCWIAAGTAIGGGSLIGERCFLALNATVGNEVVIGADSILGAHTLLTKSVADKSVLIERDTELFRLDSDQFLRISRLR
ncbi:MAG: acetyltransferase [Candidatus Accumulibacter sp. UW26]|jgi:sugar O-acyltransferase (sialic acid O-acetyltransferase NeuD family)